jgi:hypothetical protein
VTLSRQEGAGRCAKALRGRSPAFPASTAGQGDGGDEVGQAWASELSVTGTRDSGGLQMGAL